MWRFVSPNEPSPQHVARAGAYLVDFCASPAYLAEHGTPHLPEDLAHLSGWHACAHGTAVAEGVGPAPRGAAFLRVACPITHLLGQNGSRRIGVFTSRSTSRPMTCSRESWSRCWPTTVIEPTPGSTLWRHHPAGIHSSPQVKAFVQFWRKPCRLNSLH